MKTRIVMVFHEKKVKMDDGLPVRTWVNPTLSVEGMTKVLDLVPVIGALGPFNAMFCSRLARALDTASVLALELDVDFETMPRLGQYGNKEGEKVQFYPGYEDDGYVDWQDDGFNALLDIADQCKGGKALVISHRPVIGGIIAHVRGITDEAGIKAIVNDPSIVGPGYVVFDVEDDGTITMVN